MAKRRRRAVNWFPTFGQTIENDGTPQHSTGIWTELALDDTGSINTIIFPLTFDEPRDDDAATAADTTLADFISSGYLLQRIVGKCYIEYPWTELAGDPLSLATAPGIKVAAGFFVAREADQVVGVPIGANEDYNVLEVDNMREPWIWRRSWILSSPTVRQVQAAQLAQGNSIYLDNFSMWNQFPSSTAFYSSVLDGPHVDAKTKRVITGDDRLFFAVSGHVLPFGGLDTNIGVDLNIHLDYRLLGSMIKAGSQKGSF